MARRSIESRMDRLVDKLLPPRSIERKLWDNPELRARVELHHSKVERIILRVVERDGPGSAFARLADNDLTLPQMPKDLREALRLPDPPIITVDMTTDEASAAYLAFMEGPDS
jgi:hypothetical protein